MKARERPRAHRPGLPQERNWWAALDSEEAEPEREAPALEEPDSGAAHWEKAARPRAHLECPASVAPAAGRQSSRITGKEPPRSPRGPSTFYQSLKTRETSPPDG